MTKTTNGFCWYAALLLSAVGSLNWGLLAILETNIVERIFGSHTLPSNLLYISVGISGLYIIYNVIVDIISD